MWLVLLCVVAAVVGFYLFQSKQKNKASLKRGRNGSARPRQESKANQYRAISICCEEHACAAAVASQNKRYLVNEVPALPLAGCDAGSCGWRYEHHDDRRNDEGDRRLNFGLSQDLHAASSGERRECRDRRRSK